MKCFVFSLFFMATYSWSATYTIPTDDVLLKPYSTFEIPQAEVTADKLRYTLPMTMVGETRAFEADFIGDGENGKRFYEGPAANATCQGVGEDASCQIRFKRSVALADRSKRDKALSEIYPDPDSFALAQQLLDRFADEQQPIGVIDSRKGSVFDGVTRPVQTRYLVGDRWINATVCLHKPNTGTYVFGSSSSCLRGSCRGFSRECELGKLVALKKHGNFISGFWQVDDSQGWVQWQILRPNKFKGIYSFSTDGRADGAWCTLDQDSSSCR
ncbi:MAG: hypothetical protein HRU19_03075 [Pseudobacteriovorax sp.]|nr:hypothetical protein [Pseudobacteriovorax sp.]